MIDDLYFIPIIVDALDAPNREHALEKAFETIKTMGQDPKHRQGYEQFRQFMQEVAHHASADDEGSFPEITAIAETLIIELATETFGGSDEQREAATKLINAHPEWKKALENLRTELEQPPETSFPTDIIVERHGEPVRTASFDTLPGIVSFPNIGSGYYTIRLATGRVIWEGELTDRHLAWSRAFPGRPLDMAADTGDEAGEPTLDLDLLNGDVHIRVFPGTEKGRIQVEVRPKGNSTNV